MHILISKIIIATIVDIVLRLEVWNSRRTIERVDYNYGDFGEKGIMLVNSSYNTIVNNIIKRSGDRDTYGITETGTSDYNRILDNNLNEVGTIISNRKYN